MQPDGEAATCFPWDQALPSSRVRRNWTPTFAVGQIFPSGVITQRPKVSTPVWPWLPACIPLLGRRRSALSYVEGITSEPPPTQSRIMSLIKVLKWLKFLKLQMETNKQTRKSICQYTVMANENITTVFMAEIQQNPEEEERFFTIQWASWSLYLTLVS